MPSNITPRHFLEYGFFIYLFYSMLSPLYGVSIPAVGAMLLSALTFFCIVNLKYQILPIFRAVFFPVGCAFTSLAIQILVHGETLAGSDYLKPLIFWVMSLIVLQSLAMKRQFLHRFVFASLAAGFLALPFIGFGRDVYHRAAIEEGGIYANSNALGGYFGFCAIYLIVAGLGTRKNAVRFPLWGIALVSLYIVGLTVSRAAMAGVIIAILIALRHVIRKSFLPVLVLFSIVWVALQSGPFQKIVDSYTTRGTEETGRLVLWPAALHRFLEYPVFGTGASNMQIYMPKIDHFLDPHNAFLYIAVASGAIPLAFFLVYWVQGALGTLRANKMKREDFQYRMPLFTYAFLLSFESNGVFMLPWMIVVLSLSIAELNAGRLPQAAPRAPGLRTPVRRAGNGSGPGPAAPPGFSHDNPNRPGWEPLN